jgi:hypothetical protein
MTMKQPYEKPRLTLMGDVDDTAVPETGGW